MTRPEYTRPPALARWLLEYLTPPEYQDVVLSDADEEFERRLDEGRGARLWYWKQALHPDVWRLRKEGWVQPTISKRRGAGMGDLLRVELGQALRVFRRSPGFVVAVVATLAVGIGGTTTIFSLINGLLLRPMPGIVDAHHLVVLEASEGGGAFGVSSFADYQDLAERSRSLSALAAFKPRSVDADAGKSTESFGALMVTSSYFDVVGVRPRLGRFFSPDVDTGPSAHPEAVLTASLWSRRFGNDPEVVGQTILLNGRPYAIIGVAPPGFVGTQLVDVPDVFVPMTMQPDLMPASGYLLDRRGWSGITQVGRLAEGATVDGANDEIAALGGQLAVEYPNTNSQREYHAVSFRDGAMPGRTKGAVMQMSVLLVAIVTALWMVVCLNVSNLLLARSLRQRSELAIRAALGASRTRIAGKILLEFLTIALVAGVVGMGLAQALSVGLATLPLPILFDAGLDATTVAFAGALAVLSALGCAFVPCVMLSATNPGEANGSSRRGADGGKRWSSRALVVGQVSVSVVLLFGTGLFARSFANLTLADPGFDASNVATAQFDPGLQGYDSEQIVDYYQRLTTALSDVPGVAAVTMANGLPSTSNFGSDSWFLQNAREPEQSSSLFLSVVSSNYFATMDIPVVSGRGFSEIDTADQPPVVVVNAATARLVESRSGSPTLGQRISPSGPGGPFLEIVGIVGDSRTGRTAQAAPFVYGMHDQVLPLGFGGQRMVVMLKTTAAPESVSGELRRVAREVDPSVAASNVITMERFLADLLVADRLIVTALSLSSFLAALLVAVGVYGLLACVVGQRTREFGIRLALGARAATLRGIVVKEALGLAVIGLLIGVVGALAGVRLVQDQLFEVRASDPASLLFGGAVVVFVTLAAAYAPARRAMRADPMVAIRAD